MELWFIYTIVSIAFTGLQAFVGKIAAAHNHDSAFNTGVSSLFTAMTALAAGLVLGTFVALPLGVVSMILFLALVNGVFFAINAITRIESLRYIDTTLFMPLYKTLGPILALVGGVFLFAESIQATEWVGIAISLVVPLLLIHKSEHTRQKALVFGLALAVVSTIAAVIAQIANKDAAALGFGVLLFMVITLVIASLFSFATLYIKRRQQMHMDHLVNWDSLKLGMVSGVFQFGAFFTLLKAFETGGLGVVYTTHSLYIIVPIVLAVFWFNEHINLRKGVAIVLSLAALYFLS